jgi:acyl-CoA synthetase (AMP-forming)/AMP-acid ligase II
MSSRRGISIIDLEMLCAGRAMAGGTSSTDSGIPSFFTGNVDDNFTSLLIRRANRKARLGIPQNISSFEEAFQGYWHNDEATNKKFLRDVFKKGDLYYRSGDAPRLGIPQNISSFWINGNRDEDIMQYTTHDQTVMTKGTLYVRQRSPSGYLGTVP